MSHARPRTHTRGSRTHEPVRIYLGLDHRVINVTNPESRTAAFRLDPSRVKCVIRGVGDSIASSDLLTDGPIRAIKGSGTRLVSFHVQSYREAPT